MASLRLERALAAFAAGQMLVLVDDEGRENEGDLALAAQFVTPQAVNFMATFGRGLICLAMTGARLDALALPMMVADNTSPFGTGFTVSIEAARGVTTGISAFDRARTIAVAQDPASRAADLVRPGHVFPLRAHAGGVLARIGQTEGSVDLARLAGLTPAAVICEVMADDGHMARGAVLDAFVARHRLPVVSVAELVDWRWRRESPLVAVGEAPWAGGDGHLTVHHFHNRADGLRHAALAPRLISGDVDEVTVEAAAGPGDGPVAAAAVWPAAAAAAAAAPAAEVRLRLALRSPADSRGNAPRSQPHLALAMLRSLGVRRVGTVVGEAHEAAAIRALAAELGPAVAAHRAVPARPLAPIPG